MAKSRKSKVDDTPSLFTETAVATAATAEPKPVTLIKEAGEGTVGIELDETNQYTDMFVEYFSSLREHSVDKNKIYGESLEHLVAQLEFLARMAGTLGFVDKSLGAEMSPEDTKLYRNIEQSVQTVTETIVEKFKPIPR